MNPLPNLVRDRLKAAQGGDHPDPDLLTAFAEQALPERERSRVLVHLSACADCREVLALAQPPVSSASGALDTARPTSWFRWPVLRWGAAVACVVIVGSAVLMRREIFHPGSANMERYTEAPPVVTGQPAARAENPVLKPQNSLKDEAAVGTATPSQLSKDSESRDGSLARPANEGARGSIEQDKNKAVGRSTNIPLREAPMVGLLPSPAPAEKRADRGGTVAGSAGAVSGGVGSVVAYQSPAAPVAEETKKLQAKVNADSRKDVDLAAAPPAHQTVEVSASSGTEAEAIATDNGDKREALGKAKPAAPVFDAITAESNAVTAANEAVAPASPAKAQAKEAVSRSKSDRMMNFRMPISRWTISSDGQLQHSTDSGQTWQPVAVADKATFRALSANGPDIWVGGAAGALYHSSDAGAHWNQVKPASAEAALSGDIAAIEFTDIRHGKVTTATGESWITEDAGQTWTRQP